PPDRLSPGRPGDSSPLLLPPKPGGARHLQTVARPGRAARRPGVGRADPMANRQTDLCRGQQPSFAPAGPARLEPRRRGGPDLAVGGGNWSTGAVVKVDAPGIAAVANPSVVRQSTPAHDQTLLSHDCHRLSQWRAAPRPCL